MTTSENQPTWNQTLEKVITIQPSEIISLGKVTITHVLPLVNDEFFGSLVKCNVSSFPDMETALMSARVLSDIQSYEIAKSGHVYLNKLFDVELLARFLEDAHDSVRERLFGLGSDSKFLVIKNDMIKVLDRAHRMAPEGNRPAIEIAVRGVVFPC